jgi:23S rRNA-/tRNA-specific pseudouridylate synthase
MRKKPDPEVLYEDNHLLIVNKPAGYLVQDEPGDDRDSVEKWVKSCHHLEWWHDCPSRNISHLLLITIHQLYNFAL